MQEVLSPELVINANNNVRYSRPDRYLGALAHNASFYHTALLNEPRSLYVGIDDYNPSETVPAMVRNLIGINSTEALWHKLG